MVRHLLRAVLLLATATITAASYSDTIDTLGRGELSTRDSLEQVRTLAESNQIDTSEDDIIFQIADDLHNESCPTCKAFGWGDTHTVTFDGLSYDSHVKGEVTLLKSLSNGFTIQGRTQAVGNDPKGPAVTTGVVVHEDSQLGLPVVQVSFGKSVDSELATMFGNCPVQLFVNNAAMNVKDGTGSKDAIVQVKDKRIVIEYPSTKLRLDMQVREWNGTDCHFNVEYHLVDCRCDETLVGLLGQPDFPKNWKNDWHKNQDGFPVYIPKRLSDRRGIKAFYYALNYCLNAADSKFTYETGKSHDYFDYCSWDKGGPKTFDIDIQDFIENAQKTAVSQCTLNGELDAGCIIDCHFGGEDACNEFVTIANTLNDTVAVIEEAPIVLQVPETSANPSCPVCKAVGWGDPHIITFDGLSYDVHVKGELTLLKSLDPNSDFEIQARTQSITNHPKGPAVTTGVVVHETGQPKIQVSIAKSTNSAKVTMFGQCPVQLYVDEFPTDFDSGTGLSRATIQVNGDRIVVEYVNTNVRLDINVRSWGNNCHLSVTYFLADCRCDETLVGILGQPSGSWENDWHKSDGTSLSIPTSRRKLLGREAYDYSLNWCVDEANSHFTYEPFMRYSSFDYCTGDKGAANYDIDFEAIRNKADDSIKNKCTFNNTVDEGCLMERHFLGEDACDEYIKIVGENKVQYFGTDNVDQLLPESNPISDAGSNLPFGEGEHFYNPSILTGVPDTGGSRGSGQISDAGPSPFGDLSGSTGGISPFGDRPGTTGGNSPPGDLPDMSLGPSGSSNLPKAGPSPFGSLPDTVGGNSPPGDLPDMSRGPSGSSNLPKAGPSPFGSLPDLPDTVGGNSPPGDLPDMTGVSQGSGQISEAGPSTFGSFPDLPDTVGGNSPLGDLTDTSRGPNGSSNLPVTGAPEGSVQTSEAGPSTSGGLPDLPDIPVQVGPISDAGGQGDPHFKTWRNEHFEYHGQCDMVLVKDASFADGFGLDVQIRTKVVRFWSYIKSTAIRIGSDIFEIEGSSDTSKSLRYWINMEFQGRVKTVGGFPVSFKNPKGKKQGGDGKKQAVIIDLSSKYPDSKIEIQIWKEFIKVDFVNPSVEAFGNTVGLLGDFKTGKTLARDGATVLNDFNALGKEWQVLPADNMLFHSTEFPQFPSECVEPEDPHGVGHRRLGESTISVADAERACARLTDDLDRKDCVYDILATQDTGMAGAY